MNRYELDASLAPHDVSSAEMLSALTLSGNRRLGADWRLFSTRAFGLAGMSALTAALMFFIAANWQAMDVMMRFALVQAVVLVSVGVAYWKAPAHERSDTSHIFTGALTLATLGSGTVLALFGQTYQTGADVYELFFAWALLTLPFALAGMSGALWAVWICVLNVAFALWAVPGRFGTERAVATMPGFAVNLGLAALAYALSYTRYAKTTPAWLVRMLLTFSFVYATVGSALAIFSRDEHSYDAGVIVAFALATFVVVAITLQQKRDVYPLALTVGAWIIVSTVLLIERTSFDNSVGGAFVVSVWLTSVSAAAGAILMRYVRAWRSLPIEPSKANEPSEPVGSIRMSLRRQELLEQLHLVPSELDAVAPDKLLNVERPWYVSLLLGASGWLAGGFMLIVVALTLKLESQAVLVLCGLILIAAAFGLYKVGREGAFVTQIALAFSIAGQVTLVVGFGSHGIATRALIMFLVQTCLVWIMPNTLQRTLSALLACIALAIAVRYGLFSDAYHRGNSDDASPTHVYALAGWGLAWLPIAALIVYLIRSEPQWMARRVQAIVRPALSGLIAGLAFGTLSSHPFEMFEGSSRNVVDSSLALWPLLSSLAAMGSVAAGFALKSRALMGASLVGAILHISHFYYALGSTLLLKSAIMAAMGLAFLGMAYAFRRKGASV
jgi:uncharacterized membrane protein